MISIKFFRYGCRHSLHFPGDWRLPQLNPISSSSHAKRSRKRTRTFHEPLWFFRLRKRLFCFAGKQRCPDRFPGTETPDTWNIGQDGNRTCSYCGSIHFDDFVAIYQKSLTDGCYGIEGSTKCYKYYLRQPGVRNAGEGAIKFYTAHLPKGSVSVPFDRMFRKDRQ